MLKRENRTKQINFRLTPAEYIDIQQKAAKTGLSATAYCQEVAITSKIRSPKVPPEQAQEMAKALVRYGSNLNQVARKLNQGAALDQEALDALKGIRAGIDEIWKNISD